MDVYIVLDGPRVVGVSARQQGAELIRADEARRLTISTDADDTHRRGTMAGWCITAPLDVEAYFYKQMRVENHDVQDADDA